MIKSKLLYSMVVVSLLYNADNFAQSDWHTRFSHFKIGLKTAGVAAGISYVLNLSVNWYKGSDNASYQALQSAIISGGFAAVWSAGLFIKDTYMAVNSLSTKKLKKVIYDDTEKLICFGAGSAVVIGGIVALRKCMGPK